MTPRATIPPIFIMSPSDPPSSEPQDASTPKVDRHARRSWDIFQVPRPLKQLFDQFPLHTYPTNELPQRAPRRRNENVLHVFTTAEDAAHGRPSFNPQCLRYQAYLRFSGIRFRTVVSSNHASPSGALPFLQPAAADSHSTASPEPITSKKLRKWISTQQKPGKELDDAEDPRYETYAALLDNYIRIAWLCQLYLVPSNFALARRLYVAPCSTQPLVRLAIGHHLRNAAQEEVIKARRTNSVSIEDVMRDAEEAFQSLSDLLGGGPWFYGLDKPGIFDASVFAYTHLILDDGLEWSHQPLKDALSRYENLVSHRDRVLKMYF